MNVKSLSRIVAFAILAASSSALHADTFSATLTAGGSTQILLETNVAGVEQFTFSDTATNVLNTRTTNFLATYTDDLGVGVLNVTDVCAQVTVFGSAVPCQALAFTFTDLSLQNANIVSALGTASVVAAGNVATINFDASVGGGTGIVDFNPSPAATPEPGGLALFTTGLFSIAGIVRRRHPVTKVG